jgi:ketosteroid isomerase-like protein
VNGEPAGDVARSYLASFATRDPDAIAAHVAPDFVNDHASALGSSCAGRNEYRSRLPGFLASFPGLRYEVESVIVDDDAVAAEYRLMAASEGHPIDIRGVMVMTVVDGLITRRTDYWDSLTFLRQSGAAE